MSQYPNQGQDPNQQQGQYPSQGDHTQYPPGYGSTPNMPSYDGQQQAFQQPQYQQQAFQQPQYQQQYQQPYGQSPYQQQSPYPQAPAISWDYRNIIAGVGALVAIIAFFLPFYTSSSYGPYTSAYSISGAQQGGRLWLEFIIVLVALGIVALLQFNEQLLKTPTSPTIQRLRTSLTTQPKTWYIALIAVGAFGIFFHFILDLGNLGDWGIGSWLFLLGLIAIVVGGVLFVRPPTSAPAPFQNPPGGPPPLQ